jgi:ClpP class serine protease
MNGLWLLSDEARVGVAEALARSFQPTAELQAEFAARLEAARDGDMPRNMTVEGGVATIDVVGILTKTPSLMALWFGGGNTTYGDICAALDIATNDPTITSAVLRVDSPGGQADGLFDATDALVAFTKPISTIASLACSAAYALAANGGKIEATSRAANFGSIGTAISFYVDPAVVTLTNSDSPKKRPDLTTTEGKAAVVDYLDSVNELFVDAIAEGRGVEAKDVTKTYGKGSTLLAGEAQRLGMIDTVAGRPGKTQQAATSGGKKKPMNANELKISDPKLFAEVFALGSSEMHDRVKAHLTLGKQTGAMDLALKSIETGAELTAGLSAQYVTFGLQQLDVKKRQIETDAAGAILSNAASPEGDRDVGDIVVDMMRQGPQGAHVSHAVPRSMRGPHEAA